MEVFRRTLLGGILQVANLLQIPMPILPNSTLNEKLGIQPAATLGVNEFPALRYMTIGIGAHAGVVGVDGLPLIQSIQHSSGDAAPYRMLPFVMREVGNDLTPSERERFALRRIEVIGGVSYIVYYARRLDVSNCTIRAQKRTIVNSVTTTVDYVPNASNLSPTPPALDGNGNVISTNGEFLAAVCKLEIILDSFEVTEILNAAVLLYGREDYAFISEIGMVSGVNRMVSVSDGDAGTFSFNEVVCSQIFTHINVTQPLKSQRDGVTLSYDVGAAEPVFSQST